MDSTYIRCLEEIIANDLFITTDKYLDFATEEGLFYAKRDFLFRPGRWRDEIVFPPHLNFFLRSRAVITGHSDLLTDEAIIRKFRKLNHKKVILGTNMIPISNVSAALPLGLTNNCDDTPIHRILGSTNHFPTAHKLSDYKDFYDSSMYLNFTATNNVNQRAFLLKVLSGRKKTLIESPKMSDQGRMTYLKNLKSHCLVPCPEGNGVDTHRLWETLYMGGTPIILKNPVIDPLVENLPVIKLNDWSEIRDEEFLHSEWNRVHNTEMKPEKLSVNYWLCFIKQFISSNSLKDIFDHEV